MTDQPLDDDGNPAHPVFLRGGNPPVHVRNVGRDFAVDVFFEGGDDFGPPRFPPHGGRCHFPSVVGD